MEPREVWWEGYSKAREVREPLRHQLVGYRGPLLYLEDTEKPARLL